MDLDSHLATWIRETVRAAVRAELAPALAELAALRAALPPTTVDIGEAARRLGVSASSIRRWIRSGELAGAVVRVGRTVRLDLSALRPKSEDEVARLAREARAPSVPSGLRPR